MGKKTDTTTTTDTLASAPAAATTQPKKRKRTPLDPELQARIDARKSADKADKAIGKAWTVLGKLDAPGVNQAVLFLAGKLNDDGREQLIAMLTKPAA
jgi:hypothetical protein